MIYTPLRTYCMCCKLPITLPDIESELVCEECYMSCGRSRGSCNLMVPIKKKKKKLREGGK